MIKKICRFMVVILAVLIIFSQKNIFASMADFTDEQADMKLEQEQKKWEQEKEDLINKSSNNYLKSLLVEDYEITPKFDKQIINYQVIKEIDDDYIEIKAETDDEKASVSGIGKIVLNSGENNLKIEVTAENEMVRTYYIRVIKTVKQNVKLNDLKIKTVDKLNIEIEPEFNENIYEYNCTVQNYVDKIEAEASSNVENAHIEITGNENLREGLNQVIISVYLNNNEKTIYKVNVYKNKTEQMSGNKGDIEYKNIIIIILTIVLLFFLAVYIKKSKSKKRKH